jgi:DNA polymerase-3 subunit epsilon
MLNDFKLDAKSIHRLSSKGLSMLTLKTLLDGEIEFNLELWRAQGLNIVKHRGYYYFDTRFMPINEATFCIVDIETNGSKIEKHQIIEIGAIKFKNGEIIDRYQSLVKCNVINKHITEITGIKAQDTQNAPSLKDVMYKFKDFIGDSIFIAHDVKFDYRFISQSLEKIGLEPLLNRPLCSLFLAERTLESFRYALSYLEKTFNLNPEATHHRAMSDVITTTALFKLSLEKVFEIDKDIKTVEDLIRFSKHAKRLKRPKLDPLLAVSTNSS